MLPAHLGTGAFTGAIAQFTGYGTQRCRCQIDSDIHRRRIRRHHRIDGNGRDQTGCDQGAAQIFDIRSLIKIAGIETGDHLDMVGIEQVRLRHDN